MQGASCASPPAPPPGAASPRARAEVERILSEKAEEFHRVIHLRHLSREGLFLYTIDLDRIEERIETGELPALADTPTYTGLFAAMSCERAGLESGPARDEALSDADRALGGLELLMHVTGRPGLLARGVQPAPPPDPPERPYHRWFAGAPGYEQYAWRGDASQDQYANGLLPAVAACRDAFPERTRALVRDVAGMLLETGMQLVDPDGRRTTYGDLSPGAMWGFNSIARLTGYAVFALATELDDDPRWKDWRDHLRDDKRVPAGSTRTNLRVFGITNFSNDLMAWDLYRVLIPLSERSGDPALEAFNRGMSRTWRRVRQDRNPYFTFLYCRLSAEPCSDELIAQARDELARFPLEKRRLAPAPELAELPRAWLPGRKWHPRAKHLVPIELRPPDTFAWKANPYRVTATTAPSTEYTGLDYLTAYWTYRALVAPAQTR